MSARSEGRHQPRDHRRLALADQHRGHVSPVSGPRPAPARRAKRSQVTPGGPAAASWGPGCRAGRPRGSRSARRHRRRALPGAAPAFAVPIAFCRHERPLWLPGPRQSTHASPVGATRPRDRRRGRRAGRPRLEVVEAYADRALGRATSTKRQTSGPDGGWPGRPPGSPCRSPARWARPAGASAGP